MIAVCEDMCVCVWMLTMVT